MKRREFITLVGGAATAWPLIARAQQPGMPVIGLLSSGSPEADAYLVRAFNQGLSETGYVESRNVAVEHRWAEGQYDRLPVFAADLVRRRVNVIVTIGPPAAAAAKAATTTIPIIFEIGNDPIALGFVATLNRPGGNMTGVTGLVAELTPKRLELLHEMVPTATVIAALANPNNPMPDPFREAMQAGARTLGLELTLLQASSERDFDAVFATLVQRRAGALLILPDGIFIDRREQLAALTLRHAVPAIFQNREFAAAGGLMTYGSSIADQVRQAGVYAGRVLKGDKPADLPVQQAAKFELVINLKTARAFGLTVPLPLLGRADEVIQ